MPDDNIIPFPHASNETYIDRPSIEAALDELTVAADGIVIGSQEMFDAIDPLAQEVMAHVTAIRRAVNAALKEDASDQKNRARRRGSLQ
ncbi:MAG: hypothetical protein ACU0GG_16305 [Paracoccaceae bacterium]